MNYDESNKKAWGRVIRKNQMLYPNERVVSFFAKNFPDTQGNIAKNALDVGFGSGRHLSVMVDYGFNTYGIDYSEDCLDECKKILGSQVNLKLESIEENTFETSSLDAVVLFGMMFLRQKSDIKRDLSIVYNLLRNNGKILINFRTEFDFLYGKGQEVGEGSFVLDETYPTYSGMLYTFFSKEEAQGLLEEAGFYIENVEREDFWKNNLSEQHSWWIFTASKRL
ncbi:class I SAM-dependent methyltransferase [Lysinibacillus sp. Y5S-8]|uniref:class I SAM-dependent methyltransferase n=1 Tax=Lysinibacillus sp. Y5S-8 TaxID=3122488 RepID=UPI0030CC9917